MTSRALLNWNTDRATRLDRLVAAHRTLRGVDRRWITDELNHSLILRLASEFQGFARELHDETSRAVVSMIAPSNVAQQTALQLPYLAVRLLDRGNAQPDTLSGDFGRYGKRRAADPAVHPPVAQRPGRPGQRHGPCGWATHSLVVRDTAVVRRAEMERRPRVGQRVRFPFGLEELEGEVYRVEGKGELTWVTIEFYLDEGSAPTLNTFLLREIKPVQAA